ncbi:MAG: hypothetical protein J6W03_05590, partial [Bacteroidaceae bacterium]|nr:hypothetical protein [Bacteroidaceae bacterium]
MKKKTLLMTMLMLMGFSMAWAETLEIGTEANNITFQGLPTVTDANYSLSQQLYLYTELKGSMTINTISYYNAGEEATRNIDLYFKVVGSYGIGSWFTVDATEKVFSGNVTFVSNGWTTITLNTPFSYSSGTGANLCITMDDNTGSGVSPLLFRGGYTIENMAVAHSSDTDINPLDLSSTTGENFIYRSQIRLNGGPVIGRTSSCRLPFHHNYNYAVTEQIYTAEEIGGRGVITSMSFFALSPDFTRNIEVYLAHTSKSSFDSNDDWISIDGATKVFDGTFDFTCDVWST